MLLQGSLSIERLCQLVPVSRRSFYRSLQERHPAEEETEVRSVIQQIALEHRRRYGYRRITAELRRRGMQVNHKRVVRINRGVLQSAAVALCAGLPIPGRIRTQGRKSDRKSRRNDRGFCEQRERGKDFEGAAGDGDSDAVPFPRPLLLLEDARTLLQKRKLCPNDLCHERGSPQKFGPISVQN